jgi:hypothetical protein
MPQSRSERYGEVSNLLFLPGPEQARSLFSIPSEALAAPYVKLSPINRFRIYEIRWLFPFVTFEDKKDLCR